MVVSATPTGEFDGPEDPLLWNIPRNSEKYELIVRPAHLNLIFSEFISLFKKKKEIHNPSQFYLEYFPLWTLFHRYPEFQAEVFLYFIFDCSSNSLII